MRVTAQLLDVGSGAHLWGDRWDRPSDDVFAIQSEVAEAVAGQLGGYNGAIVAVDQDLAKRKRPEDLGAYEQYLVGLGRTRTWLRGRASRRRSARFERSIAIDPTLARAWTGLARSYLQLRDQVEDGRDPLRRAIDAGRRAVALDARDGEAAAALAFALGRAGRASPKSEAMFDRALALNPSSAEILTAYASWASTFGKPEAGVEAAQRALAPQPEHAASGPGQEPLRLLHDAGATTRRCGSTHASRARPTAATISSTGRSCSTRPATPGTPGLPSRRHWSVSRRSRSRAGPAKPVTAMRSGSAG